MKKATEASLDITMDGLLADTQVPSNQLYNFPQQPITIYRCYMTLMKLSLVVFTIHRFG